MPRRRLRREPTDTVPVTRVTVIDAESLADDATGSAWLRRAEVPDRAFGVFAWLMAAYRVASANPYFGDADPARALQIRLGYGSGEEVADGQWTAMRELGPIQSPAPKRRSRHRPAERLAALLSGRDATLACEELVLRARADLELGRDREAALQLEAALLAAVAELAGWVASG